MNVTASVLGRFHVFDMARELESRGALSSLITSFPKFEVVKYGVPGNKVRSLATHELRARIWSRFVPQAIKSRIDPTEYFCRAFDSACARQIDGDCDIFIGWASKALRALERAKKLGKLTILDRSSSHCLEAKRLLEEEGEICGQLISGASFRINKMELAEYATSDFILVPSKFVFNSFVSQGTPESKLIHVPYGVNTDLFRPKPRKDDCFRVIYVGSMKLRKGVHYLLQAFAELNLPKAELWLVGSKSPEIDSYFEKYRGLFHYHGHIPQAQLPDYYSQADLLAICSVEEGQAYVQSQAMACGIPLLCTTNTGGEDLIVEGESGFVIPIRSVEAIKERIRWCFDHRSECREMGNQALTRVRSSFSWNAYGERLFLELQRRFENHRSGLDRRAA